MGLTHPTGSGRPSETFSSALRSAYGTSLATAMLERPTPPMSSTAKEYEDHESDVGRPDAIRPRHFLNPTVHKFGHDQSGQNVCWLHELWEERLSTPIAQHIVTVSADTKPTNERYNSAYRCKTAKSSVSGSICSPFVNSSWYHGACYGRSKEATR